MKKHFKRLMFAALAAVFLAGLMGCRTDVEVERTKLPSIDAPEKKVEKQQ